MEQRKRRRSRRREWPAWANFFATTVLALPVALFLGGTRGYFVPSASMAPTLLRGDRFQAEIFLSKRRGPRRGELWVFQNPRPNDGNGPFMVKRVVAVPGDTVGVSRGRLMVNGAAQEEPYSREPMTEDEPERKLGPDEYWVLGDNRSESEDSRAWGPVPRGSLIGKVFVRYWPAGRLAWF